MMGYLPVALTVALIVETKKRFLNYASLLKSTEECKMERANE
jgi:hypothetical protein